MPTWLRFPLGTAVTAGLCYASYWLWLFAEKETKGTPVGDFRFFVSVLAVFAMLSLVQVGVAFAQRLFAKPEPPSES